MVDLKFLLDHKLTKEGQDQDSPKDIRYSVVSDQEAAPQYVRMPIAWNVSQIPKYSWVTSGKLILLLTAKLTHLRILENFFN